MPEMNRPMAEMLAAPVASFLRHHRPDLNTTTAVIAAELTKSPTEHAVTMQAAWKLAGDLAARRGAYKTFAGLTEIATGLVIAANLPVAPAPVSVPQASYQPYTQNTSHQPVNPRFEPECPTHPGQRAANCGGCRADQLASTPAEYPALRALPDIA